MKRSLVAATCLSLFCTAIGASASQQIFEPGLLCKFYSGTSASDIMFSRAQGFGVTLQNISGAPAKVECPIPWDSLRARPQVQVWTIDAAGTAGWDTTKCNLYGQSLTTGYSFPSNSNHLKNDVPGYTTIQGSLLPGFGSFGSTLQMEIICVIPPAATIQDYWIDIDVPPV